MSAVKGLKIYLLMGEKMGMGTISDLRAN